MIRVQLDDFDPGLEIQKLSSINNYIGGISSFIGLVRDMSNGRDLSSMTLEHYPGMTEKMLSNIREEALKRWSLEGCLIIHRYGRLEPGERIVMVATASSHRHEALASCEFLIDCLKTKAPFWKLECSSASASGKWVEPSESDNIAATKWNTTRPETQHKPS